MPRRSRKESPTGYYHIMTRGINKDKIFKSKRDKEYLLRIIKKKIDKDICKIYSYCIMDNHIHLLIEGNIDNLSLFMKKINTSYAFYYNQKSDRIGPVFQDRFKSEIIYDQVHFLGVLRYIHNNPVKANMVSNAELYNWSSMIEYLKNENNIINKDALDILKDDFKSIDSFLNFHLTKDKNIYLEIEEDYLIRKDEIGKQIVDEYLKAFGKSTIEEIKDKDKLIEQLLEKEIFSYREIASLLGCSTGKVSNVNKISRP